MTTTLLKYLLKGMLKGIEDYESMLEKEHVDPKGKLMEIIPKPELVTNPEKPPVVKASSAPSGEKIDLDELLKGT